MRDENLSVTGDLLLGQDKVLDVRTVPCSIKHGLILKVWRELPVGDSFILLNNHDPVQLRNQFQAVFPGAFSWDYIESGPSGFRVRITKRQPLPKDAGLDMGECPGH